MHTTYDDGTSSIYYMLYIPNIGAIMQAVPSPLDPRPATLTHAEQSAAKRFHQIDKWHFAGNT